MPDPAFGRCPRCGAPCSTERHRRGLPVLPDGARSRGRRPDVLELDGGWVRPGHPPATCPRPAAPCLNCSCPTPMATTTPGRWSAHRPTRCPPADRPVRLQLLGEIARGGMGAVLKGRDPDLGRDLAVKVLLESHQRQARAGPPVRRGGADRRPAPASRHRAGLRAGHVRRPPAVLHHEAGQGPDAGGAAGGAASRRAHDLPRFLAIFEAVCQTMAYAHARGVIHRDLKPSNIMVGALRRGPGDGLGPGQGA